jgi:endo-1,4-beta-mannosidase
MVRELENGKIELIDQDEYIKKVEALVSNLSQLFTKNPALVKVATEVEIAPTIKDE